MTPGVLLCSGLDPSGGAGFIADVRVAALLDTRPVGVVTATTVQNTLGVASWQPVAAEHLREQLEHLLSDVEVRAVKIGMLGSLEAAVAIGHALQLTSAPMVWDPVLAATRGVPLAEGDLDQAIAALRPHLTLLTPNAGELELLAGARLPTLEAAVAAGIALAQRLDTAVLVKGGHFGGVESIDVVVARDSRTELHAPRIAGGEHVHGTGCALSTAIAAHLARGASLVEACRAAKQLVSERLASPQHPGRGAPAIV